ncbi:MAG: GAF domain-containing protein [Chloroflexota bacterium]|nr:MAG: GAF domain-containing protein [Chloroflexota bacterium]
MPVFQVSSRSVQQAAPPKKKPRRLRQEWSAVIRFVLAVSAAGGLFALLAIFIQSEIKFILLPVFVYLAATQFQRHNLKLPVFVLNMLLNNTPVYLLLTICLAFIYYGAITGVELLIHPEPTISRIILVTTTLAWAIILDPVRVYFQSLIEQRFNLRNREAVKTIEAFTSTLREEIDLDQLRERFLTVVQQTMQPYSVSLWVRISHEQQEQSSAVEEIMVSGDDPLIAYVLSHPGALEIDRLQLDSPVLQDLRLHAAEIILPLASQGELIGLLILGPRLGGEAYTREERTLLDTLAPQVSPALRVAQMVQEQKSEVRERERIEQELRTAQDIQRSLLPKDVPLLPGWQIAPYYRPAREVGGDFYDFLPFEDGRVGIVIGDVTDKGVPAALVMATTHTMLRAVAQETISPGEALAKVNDLLYAEIPPMMFVTCFYAILDPGSGRLRYANAGQDLPYRQHAENVSELRATGMPLGMMPGSYYEEFEVTVAPGENLLFYSDGLVEAHNAKREMFGFPRLMTLIGERSGGNTLINFLLSELTTFTGDNWEQEDDITMVVVQRASSSPMEEASATPMGGHTPTHP